jgi:hypothetical protein
MKRWSGAVLLTAFACAVLAGVPAFLVINNVAGIHRRHAVSPGAKAGKTVRLFNNKEQAGSGAPSDTAAFQIIMRPEGGLFNRTQPVVIDAPPDVRVYYTFDTLAPPESFKKYEGPLLIPDGASVLRCYGKDAHGRMSAVKQASFVLDMVAPEINVRVTDGSVVDTLHVSMKERGVIRYTLDGTLPTRESSQYVNKIDKSALSRGIVLAVPHKGRGVFKARAWDEAGNQSGIKEWERKYDSIPPRLSMQPSGGVFSKPPTVFFTADEPVRVYYTFDGTAPGENSPRYDDKKGITVSREGKTVINYRGIDEAGNSVSGTSSPFFIDSRPPLVRMKMEGSLQQNNFRVRLDADEPARIYYEIGKAVPTESSPRYASPVPLQTGQIMTYFAVDSLGNKSKAATLDELKEPSVSAAPEGGRYNRKVKVGFTANVSGTVYWRLPPDTVFRSVPDTVSITDEGLTKVEYYMLSQAGLRSQVRRSEYYLDWTSLKGRVGKVPEWLDTISPRVEILPDRVYHSSVFMITLSANKRAKFRVGINSKIRMLEYAAPISIVKDTAVTVYYYGEDDFGNKSALDSMQYVLDTRPPRLTVTPAPGYYEKGVTVRFATDEPCRFEYRKKPSDTRGSEIEAQVRVTGVFDGFITAIDSAGNRTVSEKLRYVVDTNTFDVTVTPKGGLFNKPQPIIFSAPNGVRVYYTFDPLAPPEWFRKYEGPVLIPNGLNVLRYFGKDAHGRMSMVEREKYLLDMVAPKIHLQVMDGAAADTLRLAIKKRGVIRYTLDGTVPTERSAQYRNTIENPELSKGIRLVVPHKGKGVLKAMAWDDLGNQSELVEWERKYDFVPPTVTMVPLGGVFNAPPVVRIVADKPARIYYTIDGSRPDENGILFDKAGTTLSREGTTIVRCCAIDEAENRSAEVSARFFLDSRPPVVRVQIDGTLEQGSFDVRLVPDEPATIYYETGGAVPTPKSPVYKAPVALQTGQVLAFMAADSLGNMSKVKVIDELKKPMVSASPEGGFYNRRVAVRFHTNVPGTVFWRMLPDTLYKSFRDSVMIKDEGAHSLEYYLESQEGLKSVKRRNEYFTDWTAPAVGVSIRRGANDSVSVFFESSENATIYYTIDGTNPFASPQVRIAGNKYSMSRDRISLLRTADVQLAFYAEDAVGNQSALTVLDVLKPRVIPDVPAGTDRIYDRILSVSLNTLDQTTIYYCRHGGIPTVDSSTFSSPLTLIASDTIVAFAEDVSGFRGDLDTFIYLIDLPPSPHFTINPDTIIVGAPVVFDASTTVDRESPLERLTFRWDLDGDGLFEVPATSNPRVTHMFVNPGRHQLRLEVIDGRKRTAVVSRTVMVFDRCPTGMVSVADDSGRSLCIDKYEYPNEAGRPPLTGVSWVEAKVACIDAGKRLCTRQEWESVCRGGARNVYPYGDAYDRRHCPTEGKKVWNAGSFKRCGGSGVYDMVGNTWEWVEDKRGDYPLMTGGSFREGKDAYCGLAIPSTLAARADDVGFRCCK